MDHQEWLEHNKLLRMDANLEIFQEDRRLFHLSRYEFAKKYCEGKAVLDAACGTGYGTAMLGTVATSALGIDCDQNTIKYANDVYKSANVDFRCSYVELTGLEDQIFDVIVSFETVEHTLCPNSHMREISRLLKPQGCAILSVPNSWGLTDHHFWDFDLELLESVASPYFGRLEYFFNNSTDANREIGIGPLTQENLTTAECIVAVCSEKTGQESDSVSYQQVMNEIYAGVFSRHQEFLELERRTISLEAALAENQEVDGLISLIKSKINRVLR